ncbi:hypothetical protein FJW07_17725 [Mesorhizobium sp. B3-1-9]|uniref:hypothetical protein n=1 Tax=Mesorhizobium sp. B3-1-9 TaxID=2589892 RepID=UPI00112A6FCF|nr:hypothetical protein [Mesorhizobium sp. B3-1-9]TPI37611.1 hypothetical protein FJW07_17725 [Mesorhizobium sp. B3-1-9]
MHDGGGHDYITFGWIATIIGLLLFGALGQSYTTSKHQSSYYAQRCAQQYPDSPFAAANIHSSAGKPEAQPADNSQKAQPDWCDLAAQQSVAEDTKGMHWAAWGGLVFTAIGIFFIWRTLSANTKAVEQAKRSADIAERALLDIERPHLFITATKPLVPIKHEWADLPDNQRPTPEAAYSIKNFGRTPAIINEIRASLRLCVLPPTPHYHPGEINNIERVIGPDDAFNPVAFDRGGLITNKILKELFLSEIHIQGREPFHMYLYGEITYTSVYGITDQIGFIYRYSTHGQMFHLENIPAYTFRRRGVAPTQNG